MLVVSMIKKGKFICGNLLFTSPKEYSSHHRSCQVYNKYNIALATFAFFLPNLFSISICYHNICKLYRTTHVRDKSILLLRRNQAPMGVKPTVMMILMIINYMYRRYLRSFCGSTAMVSSLVVADYYNFVSF